MVMRAKNTLCALEAGFACAQRKVVCVHKEDRIGMLHKSGCTRSSDLIFNMEYMRSKVVCSVCLGALLHCVTSIVFKLCKKRKVSVARLNLGLSALLQVFLHRLML
jgi:hypothetical protein